MNTNEVKQEFDQTFTTLLEKLSTFDQSKINLKPAPEKWSAAQVAQHLIVSGSGFSVFLTGETQISEREPNYMVERIAGELLNFEIKMEAPDFIIPEEKDYRKDELLAKLKEVRAEIVQTAETENLSKTCLAFEFPGWGYLTGLETLAFVTYHTQRHLRQLDNISKSI